MKKFKFSNIFSSEIFILIIVIALVAISVFPLVNFILKHNKQLESDTAADLLLQESMEAVYNIYLADWNLYPNGIYTLATDLSNNQRSIWSLEVSLEDQKDLIAGRYRRKIEIEPVYREPKTGELGTSFIDENSKKVTTVISWEKDGQEKKLSAQLLLINNLSYVKN